MTSMDWTVTDVDWAGRPTVLVIEVAGLVVEMRHDGDDEKPWTLRVWALPEAAVDGAILPGRGADCPWNRVAVPVFATPYEEVLHMRDNGGHRVETFLSLSDRSGRMDVRRCFHSSCVLEAMIDTWIPDDMERSAARSALERAGRSSGAVQPS